LVIEKVNNHAIIIVLETLFLQSNRLRNRFSINIELSGKHVKYFLSQPLIYATEQTYRPVPRVVTLTINHHRSGKHISLLSVPLPRVRIKMATPSDLCQPAFSRPRAQSRLTQVCLTVSLAVTTPGSGLAKQYESV